MAWLLPVLLLAGLLLAARSRQLPGERFEELWARLSRWGFYTVLIALAPLALDYANALVDMRGRLPPVWTVYQRGELCLVTTALAGVALGEIIGISDKAKTVTIVLGGLCTVSGFVGAALYVIMKTRADASSTSTLTLVSEFLFVETLVSATCAIVVAELRK